VPLVTANIIDTNVEPNAAYQYLVRALDSQGQWILAFPEVVIGYASTGVTLICRGTLAQTFDWPARYVDPCDFACLGTDPYGTPRLSSQRRPTPGNISIRRRRSPFTVSSTVS
jgi:hypothetical protein